MRLCATHVHTPPLGGGRVAWHSRVQLHDCCVKVSPAWLLVRQHIDRTAGGSSAGTENRSRAHSFVVHHHVGARLASRYAHSWGTSYFTTRRRSVHGNRRRKYGGQQPARPRIAVFWPKTQPVLIRILPLVVPLLSIQASPRRTLPRSCRPPAAATAGRSTSRPSTPRSPRKVVPVDRGVDGPCDLGVAGRQGRPCEVTLVQSRRRSTCRRPRLVLQQDSRHSKSPF